MSVAAFVKALKVCDKEAKDYTTLQTCFNGKALPALQQVLDSPLEHPLSEAVTPLSCAPDAAQLSELLDRVDVWFLVLEAMANLLSTRRKEKERTKGKKSSRETANDGISSDAAAFFTKCFVLASSHPIPSSSQTLKLRWPFLTQEKRRLEASDTYTQSNNAERRKLQQSTVLAIFTEKQHKAVFSHFWLELLTNRTPALLDIHLLHTVTDRILPHLTNPLLLADFLVTRFQMGGLVSVLALRGLFVLMVDHGLEQPEFFQYLYSLLTPDAFASRHRYELFRLVDLCMKSRRVPYYIGAAFLKRTARIALLSPAPTLYFALPFLRQLLQRFPNCLALIHRTSREALLVEDELTDSNNSKAEGDRLVAQLFDGVDPYDPHELRLDKCKALHSTLWELCALEKHFLPACPLMVSAFSSTAIDNTPLRFEKTYGRLFTAEVTKKDDNKNDEDEEEDGEPRKHKRRVTVAYQVPTLAGLDDDMASYRL